MNRVLALAAILALAACQHAALLPSSEPDPRTVECLDACILQPKPLYQICLQTCRAAPQAPQGLIP